MQNGMPLSMENMLKIDGSRELCQGTRQSIGQNLVTSSITITKLTQKSAGSENSMIPSLNRSADEQTARKDIEIHGPVETEDQATGS